VKVLKQLNHWLIADAIVNEPTWKVLAGGEVKVGNCQREDDQLYKE